MTVTSAATPRPVPEVAGAEPSDERGGFSNSTGERAEIEAEAWRHVTRLWFDSRPKLMEMCREFDLFPPQLMVLRLLDQPKPMRDVAEAMACDSSNLTGITDRLEQRGLVNRTVSPKDRRVKLLVLTEEGERLREDLGRRMSRPPASIEALSDDELVTLRNLLAKLDWRSPTA